MHTWVTPTPNRFDEGQSADSCFCKWRACNNTAGFLFSANVCGSPIPSETATTAAPQNEPAQHHARGAQCSGSGTRPSTSHYNQDCPGVGSWHKENTATKMKSQEVVLKYTIKKQLRMHMLCNLYKPPMRHVAERVKLRQIRNPSLLRESDIPLEGREHRVRLGKR